MRIALAVRVLRTNPGGLPRLLVLQLYISRAQRLGGAPTCPSGCPVVLGWLE